MSSTSTDSHDSIIFVSEQKVIKPELHPQPVHVPETPSQNQNISFQQQEDPDTIIILETIGKPNQYCYLKTTHDVRKTLSLSVIWHLRRNFHIFLRLCTIICNLCPFNFLFKNLILKTQNPVIRLVYGKMNCPTLWKSLA